LVIGFVIALCLFAAQAQAQMFGSRSFGGGGLGGSSQGSDVGGVGTLNFNERFIRGNRRAGTFVGGDSKDRRGFVGSQQGGQTGRARPAISELRSHLAPDANRTGPRTGRTTSGVYEPRLSVAFEVNPPPEEAVAQNLTHLLQVSSELRSNSRIEASVAGRVATLRGEVVSERDRSLAERLVLFEPGIDSVKNELKVRPPSRPPAEYLPQKTPPPDQKRRTSGPR
jgi:hypothetical protein